MNKKKQAAYGSSCAPRTYCIGGGRRRTAGAFAKLRADLCDECVVLRDQLWQQKVTHSARACRLAARAIVRQPRSALALIGDWRARQNCARPRRSGGRPPQQREHLAPAVDRRTVAVLELEPQRPALLCLSFLLAAHCAGVHQLARHRRQAGIRHVLIPRWSCCYWCCCWSLFHRTANRRRHKSGHRDRQCQYNTREHAESGDWRVGFSRAGLWCSRKICFDLWSGVLEWLGSHCAEI